mmetsp:Transcript_27429/g.64972  ORF Transcript_27429/g.64972 Transcript_27429/m.64972 type:complete len:81 (-) Transcript_27429:205-447(-)
MECGAGRCGAAICGSNGPADEASDRDLGAVILAETACEPRGTESCLLAVPPMAESALPPWLVDSCRAYRAADAEPFAVPS